MPVTRHSLVLAYDGTGLAMQWNATHNTFTTCGSISNPTGVGAQNGSIFIHDNNVHSGTRSTEIFTTWYTIDALTLGTREVEGNVFDVNLTQSAFYTPGFTISGNYFSNAIGGGPGFQAWSSFTNNFVRFDASWT